MINFGLAALFIGLGLLMPEQTGLTGAGILILLQGGIGFFVGLIITIIGKQNWGLPVMLIGLLFGLIGFGVCTGGMMSDFRVQ